MVAAWVDPLRSMGLKSYGAACAQRTLALMTNGRDQYAAGELLIGALPKEAACIVLGHRRCCDENDSESGVHDSMTPERGGTNSL
jgi:hypothetical protein